MEDNKVVIGIYGGDEKIKNLLKARKSSKFEKSI